MTRKHFQQAAAVTAAISNHKERGLVARALAAIFGQANSRFQRAMFLQACNCEEPLPENEADCG